MKTSVTVWFKRAISALALVLPVSAFAQNIYIYPAAASAPRGSYQTVTAIVNGVNDKTVTWSSDGGTIVGTNPCVVNEPCTVALYTTSTGTYHLTATSNASQSSHATSTITFTASPTPRTDHPRFLVTSSMLPSLQAKGVSSNPMYQGMATLAESYYSADASIWTFSTWSGSACTGGSGPSSDQSANYRENDAWWMALVSMTSSSSATRNQYGCAARDVFMTNIGYVLNGSLDLSKGNRWSDGSESFAFTADFLMGGGYLSASDKTTVRSYFAKLAYQQVNDPFNGDLANIGSYNSPVQFDESNTLAASGMRATGNNYTQSRVLILMAAAFTFNDNTTDDPPLPNTCSATRYQVCPDGTAGSLHAYWTYDAGGMLYKDWANMEEPGVVQSAYNTTFGNLASTPMCNTLWNTPISCLGQGRGGESNEGTFYGYSLSRLRYALNALHTAGVDDPILYGPQISLGTSSYWDLRYVSDITGLVGLSGLPSEPSRWAFLTDGDSLNYYTYPSNYLYDSATLAFDAYTGRTDRSNALEWTILNTAYGLAAGNSGCSQKCGYDAELYRGEAANTALDAFIALPAADPVTNPPSDPRPSLPTDWYNGSNQHIVARDNGWGTGTGTVFSYYCPNTGIDHEHQYCGGFSLYSNGEYITKGRMEFNNYYNSMSAAPDQNIPGFINAPTNTSCGTSDCYFYGSALFGGQWWHGYQNGLDSLQHSELSGYVAAIADTTNSYNSGYPDYSAYSGITAASRSLVYLRGSNQVVYYDRGSSGSNVWDKANYLIATGAPAITGNTASWLTRSHNQKVSWTSLAPAGNAPVLDTVYTDGDATNDWEIYGRLKVDAGNVASARFLSVLQWGPANSSASSSSLVQSVSGQSFEGARTGSSLVMFMHDWPATFTGVTYAASGATTHYVADLTPNTTYAISGTGAPQSGKTDNAGVLTFTAAGTGNITVGTSTSIVRTIQVITVMPSNATVQAAGTQQYAATCSYSDGSSADCTSSLSWASSATSIATVNATSGMASGVAQGSATITAKSGTLQGQAGISVTASATLQSIAVSPASANVAIGGSQQLKATGVYSDSSTVDMTSSVNWSSSNSSVVSTTPGGLAVALAQGTANVMAKSGNFQGQASISVVQTATPVFTPASGTYTSTQNVSISTTTPSATIYYTTNGSTPTTSSAVYSGPISVSASETIQAIAVASGDSNSAVGSASYTITAQAVVPVFNPAGGTFTSAQSVTITSSTPSAVIHYTTDGTTPTTSSAVYLGSLTVSSSETLKAIATSNGYSASSAASATFTINQPTAATPSFNPAGGKYSSAQTVSISSSTPGSTIYYTTNGSTPTTGSAVYAGPITVSSSETIEAIAVANDFNNSATGSAAYTLSVGRTAAPTFSPAPGMYPSAQTVVISTSTESANVYFTTDGSRPTANSQLYTGPIQVAGDTTIKAIAISAAGSSSTVTSGSYTIALPTVATPTFSVRAGKYKAAQTVSIGTSTPGATIYFTTDGSSPTTGSTLYSGPITVAASETLTAIAVEAGYQPSSISSATYTISGSSPSFSLTVSSSSVTVKRGHASVTNVLIIPENGFAAPVELSCAGLPAGATCSFSPATVTPSGAPTATALTVTAAAEVASLPQKSTPVLPGSAAMAALGFCFLGRRKRNSVRLLSIALTGVLGLGVCSGCASLASQAPDNPSVITVVGVHDSLQPTTTFNLTLL